MIELTVKVRDENTSLTDFHVIYDPITLSLENQFMKDLVTASISKFQSTSTEAPTVKITCKMIWQ